MYLSKSIIIYIGEYFRSVLLGRKSWSGWRCTLVKFLKNISTFYNIKLFQIPHIWAAVKTSVTCPLPAELILCAYILTAHWVALISLLNIILLVSVHYCNLMLSFRILLQPSDTLSILPTIGSKINMSCESPAGSCWSMPREASL